MRLTSSAILSVLLAAAGCGGGDGSFAADYNRAVRPLSGLGEGLAAKPEVFERLARSTERTRAKLARLDAPEGAGEEFDALLARLDRLTGDLSAIARAERSRDIMKQRRAAERLVRSGDAFQRAEKRLKRAVEA